MRKQVTTAVFLALAVSLLALNAFACGMGKGKNSVKKSVLKGTVGQTSSSSTALMVPAA